MALTEEQAAKIVLIRSIEECDKSVFSDRLLADALAGARNETPGLDWIGGEVRAIEPDEASLKIPHMGWNTLTLSRDHALFDGIPTGAEGLHAYFVHSYHFVPEDADTRIATTDYGGEVTAFVARDNMAGSQFHPEKSQKMGLALLANFLKWMP